MRSALRCNDRVAVGIAKAFFVVWPGNCPFNLAFVAGQLGLAGKGRPVDCQPGADLIIQKVQQSVRKIEFGFGRDIIAGSQNFRSAFPEYFNSLEQKSL